MSSQKITFRQATIADLALLEYWDTQPHVIASDPDSDWNWKEELLKAPPWREQLIAALNQRPIGVVQIIDPALEESHYWGDVENDLRAIDIWIGEKEDLGKGYGTIMMKLAINRCFQVQKVKAILIDPLATNKKAHRFYERLGFQFLEKRNFEGDECYVYQITRQQWKRSK